MLRTGLAGIVGGLALIKFVPFESSTHLLLSHIASVVLMFWGILVIIIHLNNFRNYLKELNQDKIYTTYNRRVLLYSTLLILAAVILLLVMIPVL